MIKKHPKGRGERRHLKDLHDNASPVFKLLKEKELLDAVADKRDRVLSKRRHSKGLGGDVPPDGVSS